MNTSSKQVDTTGKAVVWCYADDNTGKYTIADGETEIDLTQLLSGYYNYSFTMDIIVGTADQLDTANIRYRVRVYLPLVHNVFKLQFANTDRKAITTHRTWSTSNEERIYASVAPEDYTTEPVYHVF